MKLSEEQNEVVNCNDSKIVCIAGAGSGKTECMLQRINRIVSEGIDGEDILVLTFTHNAAVEMKLRYAEMTDSDSIPFFGTFHSFCYSLMCDEKIRSKLGYNVVPRVAEDEELKRIQTKAKLFSGIKFDPDKCYEKKLSVKDSHMLDAYRRQLHHLILSENIITYDELLRGVCNLFVENNEIIYEYKDKYRYIFVDEFQDTDSYQWEFVNSFYQSNIYVCGDALQNLYSFRGTTNKILEDLVADKTWTTLRLTENYRSCDNIVNFANANSKYAPDDCRIQMTSHTPGGIVNVFNFNKPKFSYNRLQKVEEDYIENQYGLKQDLMNYPGTWALLCRTNTEVSLVENLLKENGFDFITNRNKITLDKYIYAAQDENYAIDFLSSCLNSKDYQDYICNCITYDNDRKLEYLLKIDDSLLIGSSYACISAVKCILEDDSLDVIDKCKKLSTSFELDINCDNISAISEFVDIVKNTETKHNDNYNDIYVGTIHSVKGLEYDSVVLFGVNDTSFRLEDNEDNHNVYYVGITRAKNYLKVFKLEE